MASTIDKTDLIQIVKKPILSMSVEELSDTVEKLRELRLVKVIRSRQKTPLELTLGMLTVERSREVLEIIKDSE